MSVKWTGGKNRKVTDPGGQVDTSTWLVCFGDWSIGSRLTVVCILISIILMNMRVKFRRIKVATCRLLDD